MVKTYNNFSLLFAGRKAMEIKMTIKIFNKLTEESKNIREIVFVNEQGFTEEYDEKEDISNHFVMFDHDGKAVATCRIFKTGKPGEYMFGRMAVLKELRGNNIGRRMIEEVERFIIGQGGNRIILHAQLHAKGFYEKLGFIQEGETQLEQNKPHVWMSKKL